VSNYLVCQVEAIAERVRLDLANYDGWDESVEADAILVWNALVAACDFVGQQIDHHRRVETARRKAAVHASDRSVEGRDPT
jgi:hypothetical protein